MTSRPGRLLSRGFYRRDPLELAPDLLNKVLVHGDRAGRIVEVEAYRGAEDPASHAYRGRTPRTEVMFGPPGHIYVYFSYGMHWCANVVAAEDGIAGAVLIRALTPLRGIDTMRAVRPAARRDIDLANGPAKACQALGIDGRLDGADLVAPGSLIGIVDDLVAPPLTPTAGPRVGISAAVDFPWRFSVPGDAHRSRPMPRP
ncbi:MAG: DNA-3-methyladenine glycosylase [Aquihabitans sp.]